MDINDFLDLEKRTICKLKGNIIVSNSKRINLYDLTKIMDNTFGNYNRTIYKLTWRIKNELNSFLKWEYRGREIDASIVSIIPSVKDNEPSITFNIVEYINKIVKSEQIIVKEGELHNYKFRKIFKTLREFINMYPNLDYSWDKSDDTNILEFSDELFTYHFDLRDTEVHSITFANPIDQKIGEIKVKDKRLRMKDYIDILDETILKRTGINTCELNEPYKRMVEKSFGINHVKNKEGLCK